MTAGDRGRRMPDEAPLPNHAFAPTTVVGGG
jgi:hypothetical protein